LIGVIGCFENGGVSFSGLYEEDEANGDVNDEERNLDQSGEGDKDEVEGPIFIGIDVVLPLDPVV
jgi:hypothetical protein